MSDYDDYENNLFFPPVGDMSKLNDCNDGKRSVDVLVSAVEKCKELEEKLRIAIEVSTQARYTAYDSCQTCHKCELIDKMLTELLEKIKE